MLVVGRKINESITLFTSDGVVVVMVTECKDGKASVGVEASKSVKIVRTELLKGNKEAS